MIPARRRALLILVAAIALGAALAAGLHWRAREERPPAERPTLLLLTSLPLIFNENFSLRGGGSAALRALEKQYRVRPISVSSPSELTKGSLLLAAHPLAQTPENLVALDDWVRRGGRLLLLADPMLEWPSKRPLGDPVRPPPMFMDTGLLAHWGLRLDSPDERGPALRQLAGRDVLTVSPGTLHGGCRIGRHGFVARCKVGKGEAVIVADADFIDVDQLGTGGRHNLDALTAELASLDHS